MKEASKNLSEMQQRMASKETTVYFHGGEKTSFQAKKYEKVVNDDELYFIIQEELRPEASKMAMDFNNVKYISQQKRREEAEKPLYLMRYE
jgi:hypothetical protein